MTPKIWASLQLCFLHSSCQVLHTLPCEKRKNHADCFPFLTLSNSDSASCSADFSIDILCSSSSTVPLFIADLYGVRKCWEKFCRAWTPQTWKIHLQALTNIINRNKWHWSTRLLTSSESKGSLVMLKSSYNIWNWSMYFCCIFTRAFSSFDSTAATNENGYIKTTKDWKCVVLCSESFFWNTECLGLSDRLPSLLGDGKIFEK